MIGSSSRDDEEGWANEFFESEWVGDALEERAQKDYELVWERKRIQVLEVPTATPG